MLGYETRHGSDSTKLQCIAVVVCGMFIYWSWGAMLISHLAVPLRTFGFNNLEQFVANTNKKVRSWNKILNHSLSVIKYGILCYLCKIRHPFNIIAHYKERNIRRRFFSGIERPNQAKNIPRTNNAIPWWAGVSGNHY